MVPKEDGIKVKEIIVLHPLWLHFLTVFSPRWLTIMFFWNRGGGEPHGRDWAAKVISSKCGGQGITPGTLRVGNYS